MLENLFEHIGNKDEIKEEAIYDQEIINSTLNDTLSKIKF